MTINVLCERKKCAFETADIDTTKYEESSDRTEAATQYSFRGKRLLIDGGTIS